MRRLPPGTLPPVVLKFDASSLPVCLVTFKGEGLNETQLRDLAQFQVRNQIAGVPGATVPQPFGGKYRQIMVYVDPYKLEAHQLSLMDVVRSVNESNLILPAGDVQIGPLDYNIYTNSQISTVHEIDQLPLKMVGQSPVRVADVGNAKDASPDPDQHRARRRPALGLLPVLKQGGDTNTIAVVDGVKAALRKLFDVPKQLITKVVFDQSVFVKTAIETLLHEGAIGLFLTSLMILVFLGSMRATVAVFFSIPLSALAAFIVLSLGGSSINTMVLGGLALAFSRLIDNSVVVLENIYRHLELGEPPDVAAEKGGREVALPVLAATLTTVVVFFPVTLLYGVSKFLFTALALAVVLSLFASYVVAMTVVPLFCARFIKAPAHHGTPSGERARHRRASRPALSRRPLQRLVQHPLRRLPEDLRQLVGGVLRRPALTLIAFGLIFVGCLALFPLLGLSFFPRTDAGQFVINVKAPSGTRIAVTEDEVAKVEDLVRKVVAPATWASSSPTSAPPRLLRHLHHQFRPAHRLRPGRPQGRPQDRQLRIHGPREAPHGDANARTQRLLPVRRPGRRRAQPRPARADRRPGRRFRSCEQATPPRLRLAAQIRRLAAWPTSSSRRTSITRRCSSTSTARAPANWGSISKKWSTTSSPR